MIESASLRTVFGKNVARLRRDKGLSQERLAEIIGLSRIQLARIETAVNLPNVAVLYALSDALEVPPDAFRSPLDPARKSA